MGKRLHDKPYIAIYDQDGDGETRQMRVNIPEDMVTPRYDAFCLKERDGVRRLRVLPSWHTDGVYAPGLMLEFVDTRPEHGTLVGYRLSWKERGCYQVSIQDQLLLKDLGFGSATIVAVTLLPTGILVHMPDQLDNYVRHHSNRSTRRGGSIGPRAGSSASPLVYSGDTEPRLVDTHDDAQVVIHDEETLPPGIGRQPDEADTEQLRAALGLVKEYTDRIREDGFRVLFKIANGVPQASIVSMEMVGLLQRCTTKVSAPAEGDEG